MTYFWMEENFGSKEALITNVNLKRFFRNVVYAVVDLEPFVWISVKLGKFLLNVG